MACIPVNEIKVGMVLTKDACDRNKRVLLGAGGIISEKHLKIFRMWGVLEVEIEGDSPANNDDNPIKQLSSTQAEEVKIRARRLFQHCDTSHAFSKELLRLAVTRLARHKLREAANGA